jgi:CheY-like chemotaxis protein
MARRALIVDDDPSLRWVLSTALSDAGWSVVESDDGSSVLERLHAERFELLVLDLYMPGMNGFEVLRQVRRPTANLLPRRKTPASVRVVVLSGASTDGLHFARRIGADACFQKPFDFDEVLKAL